jgi:hypothetical protein
MRAVIEGKGGNRGSPLPCPVNHIHRRLRHDVLAPEPRSINQYQHTEDRGDTLDVVRAGLLRCLMYELRLEHRSAIAVLKRRSRDALDVGLP